MMGMAKGSRKGRGHRVYGEFLWAFEVSPLLKAARLARNYGIAPAYEFPLKKNESQKRE